MICAGCNSEGVSRPVEPLEQSLLILLAVFQMSKNLFQPELPALFASGTPNASTFAWGDALLLVILRLTSKQTSFSHMF